MKMADVVVGMGVVANGVPGEVIDAASGWVTVASDDGEGKYRAKDIEPMEQDGEYSMAKHIRKYRERYVRVKSYTGGSSMNNGDPVAKLFEGRSPLECMQLAEQVLELADGELVAKYEHLNPGQQRMNAGNRIRGAIKRGELEVTEDGFQQVTA